MCGDGVSTVGLSLADGNPGIVEVVASRAVPCNHYARVGWTF